MLSKCRRFFFFVRFVSSRNRHEMSLSKVTVHAGTVCSVLCDVCVCVCVCDVAWVAPYMHWTTFFFFFVNCIERYWYRPVFLHYGYGHMGHETWQYMCLYANTEKNGILQTTQSKPVSDQTCQICTICVVSKSISRIWMWKKKRKNEKSKNIISQLLSFNFIYLS